MAVIGIGMDLVEIGRMERALERRPGLAERLFTARELRDAEERRRPARHLAARFAAKEAVVTAVPVDGPVAIDEIEVVGSSPPCIELHRSLAEASRAGGWSIRLSLTHEREMAGAVAIVEVDGR